jgi:hypothetical protein
MNLPKVSSRVRARACGEPLVGNAVPVPLRHSAQGRAPPGNVKRALPGVRGTNVGVVYQLARHDFRYVVSTATEQVRPPATDDSACPARVRLPHEVE